MKKFFNHTRKPYEKWNENEADNYDWDDVDEIAEEDDGYEDESWEEDDGAYYADGEYDTEGVYDQDDEDAYYAEGAEDNSEYHADEEAGDGQYYAEDEEGYYEEGIYAEEDGAYYAETDGVDDEYYTEDEDGYYADEAEEAYYADEEGEYYAEDDEYYAEEEYADEEDDGFILPFGRGRQNDGESVSIIDRFRSMGAMDRIVAMTGVAVLVLALITGGVYASARVVDKQVSDFVSVGTQLEGIELIGEKGLMAVADVQKSRLEAAEIVDDVEEQTEYNESEYNNSAIVSMDLVSVQKDLKIKFTNENSGKLISNVPFTVTVTDPDGGTATWSDDDMDGIIYKKGIEPGDYKVAVNVLTDAKYEKYILPTSTRTVEVKKDIEYKKIDVKNEIKKESEVNATKEDTKKNETVVESKLEDTVTWVESTSTANTYVEVAKSTIPDPLTLIARGAFMRTAGISSSSVTLNVGGSTTLTADYGGLTVVTINWDSTDSSVASVSGRGDSVTVTAHKVGNAAISYKATVIETVSGGDTRINEVTGTCMVTVAGDAVGSVSVDKSSVAMAAGAEVGVKATAAGFAEGKALTYAVASNNTGIATASVDGSGNITIKGVAAGDAVVTVSVNYQDAPAATPATANISVKVTAGLTMTLDKTAETVYINSPVTINATISGAVTDNAVTAESSDTNVATVSVSNRAVTITGVNAGSATITVKYTENGIECKATCAVTVKAHPKDDKTTRLKDSSGQQLYVLESGSYREAVYADYYSASQFFLKGDVKYTGWQTIDGKVYFFNASGNKVTGEQVIQGAQYTFASDGSLVTGSGKMGIDISKWNGSIDWNAVKNSGVSYVIIRSGYRGSSAGSLIEDPKFKSNIKGATDAGLKVGIYFFTQAVDEVEAIEEASMVLEQIKGYKISYPIFLDVEPSGGRGDKIDKATRTAVCKAFCKTIQDGGYTAGIYANKTWLDSKIDVSELGAYKIWLAQYAATPTYTGRYDLWQYTSTGKVSGISGDVDLNLSYLGY